MVAAIPLAPEAVAAFAAALLGDGGDLWSQILEDDLGQWAERLGRHHFADRDAEAAKTATIALIRELSNVINQEKTT